MASSVAISVAIFTQDTDTAFNLIPLFSYIAICVALLALLAIHCRVRGIVDSYDDPILGKREE